MKPDFKRGYSRNLLRWKELSALINIRPLMSAPHRVLINGTEQKFTWQNSIWSIDKNCYPPSLLQDLLEKYTCYFLDMSK